MSNRYLQNIFIYFFTFTKLHFLRKNFVFLKNSRCTTEMDSMYYKVIPINTFVVCHTHLVKTWSLITIRKFLNDLIVINLGYNSLVITFYIFPDLLVINFGGVLFTGHRSGEAKPPYQRQPRQVKKIAFGNRETIVFIRLFIQQRRVWNHGVQRHRRLVSGHSSNQPVLVHSVGCRAYRSPNRSSQPHVVDPYVSTLHLQISGTFGSVLLLMIFFFF